MKSVDVAIAIIVRDRTVLICRRPSGTHLAGLWEFPGGKLEPGESPQQCLAREVREEVGLELLASEPLPVIDYPYPDVYVRLHPFLCTCDSGQVRTTSADGARWVEPPELRRVPFPPANAGLVELLITRLGPSNSSPGE